MSSKIDKKHDNIMKLKRDIANTELNVELAEDIIDATHNDAVKIRLEEQNERRTSAISDMQEEIQEELYGRND